MQGDGDWAIVKPISSSTLEQGGAVDRAAFARHDAARFLDRGQIGAGGNIGQRGRYDDLLAAERAELLDITAADRPVPGVDERPTLSLLHRADQQQQRIDLVDEFEAAVGSLGGCSQDVRASLMPAGASASATVCNRLTWNLKFSWKGRWSLVGRMVV